MGTTFVVVGKLASRGTKIDAEELVDGISSEGMAIVGGTGSEGMGSAGGIGSEGMGSVGGTGSERMGSVGGRMDSSGIASVDTAAVVGSMVGGSDGCIGSAILLI